MSTSSNVHLVYLVGPPGVGKSTTTAFAFGEELRAATRVPDVPLEVWSAELLGGRFYYLGNPTDPEFPGTDRLSMSVHPKALEFVAGLDGPALVFGEGDRLGTSKWLLEVADAGVEVSVISAVLDDYVRGARAGERSARTKTSQDPSWVAGRVTKIANLLEEVGADDRIEVRELSLASGRFDNAARLRRLAFSVLPEPDPVLPATDSPTTPGDTE